MGDLNGGITFQRGPARRPGPEIDDPALQWATGLPTTDQRIYSGWFVERGQDATLDEAAQAGKLQAVEIRHGSGNIGHHWALPTASLFIICEGLQSKRELAASADRYGIAYGWRRNEQGRPESVLRCRVLVRELAQAGYVAPLMISLSSTITDNMRAALVRQYDVLDAAETAGKGQLPFYAFSLPLGPGLAERKGQDGKTREIIPMRAQVPQPVTREHLVAHWNAKKAWVALIEQLLPETVAWSVAESIAIAAGEVTA